MKKNSFPIFSVKGNELISISGDKSFFYQVKGLDFEQKDPTELQKMYQLLERKLCSLDPEKPMAFYRLGRNTYINSFNNLPDLGLELNPKSNPLQVFFNNSDIYSNLDVFEDYLVMNSEYKRLVSIKSFSEESIFESPLPDGFDYILNIKKKGNSDALRELERIRSSHSGTFLKRDRDFESEGAYGQAEDLIRSITHGEESIFDMELFFLVSENSLGGLNERTQELIRLLTLRGVTPFIEGDSLKNLKSGLFHLYRELIPGVRPSFKYRAIPNKITHLKFLLPLNKSFLMKEGIKLQDYQGSDIYFNPFDEAFKNRNMLVSGASGAGKSVFVNKLVHFLAKRHPVVILDKGGSFKKLCHYHCGISLDTGINPMDFKCPIFLREFILACSDSERFSKLEKGILLKEIKEFLQNSSDSSFYGLLNFLEPKFNGIRFYFEDLKGFISTRNTKQANFLYVDIDNFPKTQIGPLIIYVLEYFKNISNKNKVLVFDECWSFLRGHSEYIEECFRTFRKHGAFPIAISQGFNDFAQGEKGFFSSINNNSFFKVFFPQVYIDHNDVSEFDNNRISSLFYEKAKYSECYLKSQDGLIQKIIRVVLSPLEFELFNTDSGRSDRFFEFLKDNRKYFSSNTETINSFVRLQHGLA